MRGCERNQSGPERGMIVGESRSEALDDRVSETGDQTTGTKKGKRKTG